MGREREREMEKRENRSILEGTLPLPPPPSSGRAEVLPTCVEQREEDFSPEIKRRSSFPSLSSSSCFRCAPAEQQQQRHTHINDTLRTETVQSTPNWQDWRGWCQTCYPVGRKKLLTCHWRQTGHLEGNEEYTHPCCQTVYFVNTKNLLTTGVKSVTLWAHFHQSLVSNQSP